MNIFYSQHVFYSQKFKHFDEKAILLELESKFFF